MAVLLKITCITCGESKQECRSSGDYSKECSECKRKASDKAERVWKAGRDGLSLQERIEALENFMYHHGTHYTGPVTFG